MSLENNLEYLKIANNSSSVVVMIHGYGADMHDLHGLAPYLDDKNQFDWIFPNGPHRINLGYHMEGRAWFPIDMVALERAMALKQHRVFSSITPNGFNEAVQSTLHFLDKVTADYDEVILGGFSQGAMITSHLAPLLKKIKAAILFSGVLVASETLEVKLKNSSSLPFFQSHGKIDPLLNYNEAKELFELLKLYRWQGEFVPFQGGHEIPMDVLVKARNFLSRLG